MNYIYEQNPNKFGGNQEDYLKQSEIAVKNTIYKIQATVSKNEENGLEQLFHSVLADLAEQRSKIAISHKTKDGEKFGIRRDNGVFPHIIDETPLDCEYLKYGKITLEEMGKVMKELKHDKYKFEEYSRTVETTCLGRKSKFVCQIYENSELIKNKWIKEITLQECKDIGIDLKDIPKESIDPITGGVTPKDLSLLKTIKEKSPTHYQREKMVAAIKALNADYPSPIAIKRPEGSANFIGDQSNLKSLFALGKCYLEVNGKNYLLSQYLTWLYRDHQQDPIDRMVKCSKVTVIHQDCFLIKDMLDDIAKLFANAIRWERDKHLVSDLKDRVGLLRFELAHTMPFHRGSEAIAGWLEKAIYEYHGFELNYVKGTMGDLEAFSSLLLDKFLTNYHDKVKLG